VNFSDLVGVVLDGVTGKVGDDALRFTFSDGRTAKMHHSQDCCESVTLIDICGDLDDLVGSPVLYAEEVSDSHDKRGIAPWQRSKSDEFFDALKDDNFREPDDSFTWTFYRIGTVKGAVTLRWLGESNGYYSESVDFDLER
jgi:hypothetical protein